VGCAIRKRRKLFMFGLADGISDPRWLALAGIFVIRG